jgi:hypothetical protein
MYHLLSAVTGNAQAEAHPIPECNVSLNPIVILSALAVSVNAFNAITRGQILSTLLRGTDALVTLPDPSQLQAKKDPGWVFYGHSSQLITATMVSLNFTTVATSLLSLVRLEFSKVTL